MVLELGFRIDAAANACGRPRCWWEQQRNFDLLSVYGSLEEGNLGERPGGGDWRGEYEVIFDGN